MTQAGQSNTIPELLGDPWTPEEGVWLRADGRSRGQACAALAREIGCDFTALRLNVEWLRRDGERGGFPTMAQTNRHHPAGVRYWRAVHVR